MLGVVSAVNPGRQRAAIRRPDGTYSVVAYQSHWRLTVGERVTGVVSECGTSALALADGQCAQVSVEAAYRSAEEALQLVGRGYELADH